jgi:hypothetical protein
MPQTGSIALAGAGDGTGWLPCSQQLLIVSAPEVRRQARRRSNGMPASCILGTRKPLPQ